MQIQKFTFNYFSENTYVLYDETKECAIIDPGCCNREEENTFKNFIVSQGLKPLLFLNTHCHIDHILGNAFVADTYKLELQIHNEDLQVLSAGIGVALKYGIPYNPSPQPGVFLTEGQTVSFGTTILNIAFTPGHSPGSICFINTKSKSVIGGDVLFQGSIGRTDLPGGDFETLANSIRTKLYTLPDDYIVYPGHGDETTIGVEKIHNPFVKAGLSY
ncbi:MAG: MBL fold metallo-hydrolase [Bacteroidia bacterium]